MVEEKQMMICNECGNKLRSTAKFCKNCGTKVDPENVVMVEETEIDRVKEIDQGEEVVENISTDETTAASSIDLDRIEHYFFSYLDFLKETLMKPSSVFEFETHSWVFGTISLILFSLFYPFPVDQDFWLAFFVNVILQLAIVSLLFMLNKYFLSGKDTYLEVLSKYGGLMNTQVILSLALRIIGLDSFLGVLIFTVTLINQLNIFNLYIFNTQPQSNKKLDRYYQVLISYVALIVVVSIVFSIFGNSI
ncbi:zinc-ribbon domain-containing protein [Atopostipes suicloacalis DSM 15692]|uniref:Zinc-ribbon domain-containing protein n=1 Tax=Atopostipes suicloacalis DSM 15692 TaxID=1121025 RepID=A0A1M4X0P0_9LACT|nr:zinc ribbon domain-containing protein [Atopostipes suicloacalis]SHE86762.1 zinc-ribbon domain-containing protein [Atopostipes suicloacalis DSM 15692]